MTKEKKEEPKKRYYIDIEGKEYPWDTETITAGEMRALAKLPADLPLVEEFSNGTEKTLADNDLIVLRPGHRYGRAPKFKRG